MAKRVAVIDMGSNSIRIAIYEKTSRFAFHLLYETKSKVRISQDAYLNDKNLQKIPMQRAFEALKDFMEIISSFDVRKTLCVATSALRDAPNKQEFIQRVRKELKLNIKVIDGKKEAYFGAIACANLLPHYENSLTIDIGGGSTEFATIEQNNITNTISFELGTVRLKEIFFDQNDIEGAIKYIDTSLESFFSTIKPTTLIGIGGTFRAISTAIMELTDYPYNKLHAYESNIDIFLEFINNILLADEMQLKNLGIKEDRFDIIKPGALILQRVLKHLDITKTITSGVGVREGVYLADLLRGSKDKFPANYNTSIRYLLDTHLTQKFFANNLTRVSKNIFDLTSQYLNIDKRYKKELTIAAKLSTIGSNIHFYSMNKHSYYLIQGALEYGFNHKEMLLISTLTRYSKGKIPSKTHIMTYQELLPDVETLNSLCCILSLSSSLLKHRPRNIDFELDFIDSKLIITSKKSLYLTKESFNKAKNSFKLDVVFR